MFKRLTRSSKRRSTVPAWNAGSMPPRPTGVLARRRQAMSFSRVQPADDASASEMSRRSFVAAGAAAVLGAGGITQRGPSGDVPGTMSAPRASRTTFDPWLEVDRAVLAHNVAAVTRL